MKSCIFSLYTRQKIVAFYAHFSKYTAVIHPYHHFQQHENYLNLTSRLPDIHVCSPTTEAKFTRSEETIISRKIIPLK